MNNKEEYMEIHLANGLVFRHLTDVEAESITSKDYFKKEDHDPESFPFLEFSLITEFGFIRISDCYSFKNNNLVYVGPITIDPKNILYIKSVL